MSDLFTEALQDAEKLREIAEQDAKNSIIEAIVPLIKKTIAEEVKQSADFFFEQEEEAATAGVVSEQEEQLVTAEPAVNAGSLGEQPLEAPITPPESDDLGATSMPDEEGKIVVDFEDLFASDGQVTLDATDVQQAAQQVAPIQPATVTPTAAPEPVAPVPPATPPAAPVDAEGREELETEAVTYKDYRRVLDNVSERIDRTYFSGKISDILRESLKHRLIELLEAVDSMRNRGLMTSKQAKLNENKLEFLFLKLKEAGLRNSYNKENKETAMTLKEFAAKLFEEDENLARDSQSTGETGLAVDDEYSEHAADVSGVDPNLGGPEDLTEAAQEEESLEEGKVTEEMLPGAEPVSDKVEEVPWSEAEPPLDEKDQDETVAEAVEEASSPVKQIAEAEFEVDDSELVEAVRAIRRENIKRKLHELREASDGKNKDSWEDASPEGGADPSHENLEEVAMKEDSHLSEQEVEDVVLDEPEEMENEVVLPGVEEEADLVLSIDLPPEVEEELADLGVEDLDVDVELNVGEPETEEEEAEAEELEAPEEAEELEVSDEEELEVPGSEEEDMVMSDMAYEKRYESVQRKCRLLEKRLGRVLKLVEAHQSEVKDLRGQLAETNLFAAKAVYYSKFLQRALTEKSLTKKALQQIAEHLDKGKTVAEAKVIYTKIRQKLDEHASVSRKLGGSSSSVTKPGSAKLDESVQHPVDDNEQTPARWKVLAGIKNTKKPSQQ